ncbi:MAG: HAMP domain-containing sensor histidine kinase [Patescibacteria group bacterium]
MLPLEIVFPLFLLIIVTLVLSFYEIEKSRREKVKFQEKTHDEFTAMMVHELRAPLTVIHGTLDMFLKNPSLATQPQGQELMVATQNSTASLQMMVNDILDVSKIEANKFQLNPVADKIQSVLPERIRFFETMVKDKGVTLNLEVADSLPEIPFDRERINQVLNNLISNAIKYTPSGGKILVKAEHIPKAVKVSVIDNGAGIPADKIPELFSKFKQFGKTDGGTGLGLVIAKGIIEAHGGKIYIESKVDSGSTFSFTLPLTISN